jgi:surface antigen/peptidoglycan hydrolase CwlO-like protein
MIKLQFKKTKMNRKSVYKRAVSNLNKLRKSPLIIGASLLILGSVVIVPFVRADSIQDQINNLNAQNANAQSTLSSLESSATSYQQVIDSLQAQISSINQAIAASQAQQAQLQAEIQSDIAQIAQQKQVLGSDISAIYVNGQMTTLEELASSNNISDFVNAETYRNAVQNKIQNTLNTINSLEAQQQAQEQQVSQLLLSQKSQQNTLNSDEQAQANLLSYNQQQQAQYNQTLANNNSQIKILQEEQAAQLAALEGRNNYGGTGSYPWANAPCLGPGGGASCGNYNWGYPSGSSVPLGAPGGYYDPWGYEYRNCTSYVAWKIATTSSSPIINSLISDLGNAAEWPGGASSRGVSVSYGTNPQAGDAAVDPGGGGWQGHVMYVEAVNGDGSIDVSQYNAGEDGTYSTASISASEASNLDFIQFPGM